MARSLNIALAQTTVSTAPKKNLQTARHWIRRASDQGADLVVFPEMFMARPRQDIALAQIAEPLDGPFTAKLSALAVEHTIAVICGVWDLFLWRPRANLPCRVLRAEPVICPTVL